METQTTGPLTIRYYCYEQHLHTFVVDAIGRIIREVSGPCQHRWSPHQMSQIRQAAIEAADNDRLRRNRPKELRR